MPLNISQIEDPISEVAVIIITIIITITGVLMKVILNRKMVFSMEMRGILSKMGV